jgi:Flp pilus assembly protein TadB
MMPTSLRPWVLGAAWGVLVAVPIARRAGRAGTVARVATLASPTTTRAHTVRWRDRVLAVLPFLADNAVTRVCSAFAVRRRRRDADALVARELPVALDLLGVAVGAGCTPYLAVEVAARWSPAPLADTFADVIRTCGLGLDFEAALDAAAFATPRLRSVADALLSSDRLGVPVGPVLARLAEEERTALRRAAEAHARRIPVRLLFPLVFLVLPAFVLLTVVPGLAAGLGRL